MSYTKKQISDISGLSPRLVQFYTEEGLILPEKNSGKGRGNIRQYSKKSLIDFLIIKELANYGITKTKMKAFLKYIRINPYTASYLDHSLYNKGVKIFLYLIVTKNNKLAVNYKMIVGAKNKTALLSIDDMDGYISCITIDFGRIVEKASQE